MTTYRKYITIEDPNQITLSDLPFRAGEMVEVVLKTPEKIDGDRLKKLQALFKATQSLPQIQAITEEEIIAEINAYQSGQYFS
jgi:hypothetical protein